MPGFRRTRYPILMFAFCFGVITDGFAQKTETNKEQKTASINPLSTDVAKTTKNEDVGEDFVLDEILIEAVIEKPNVAILPTLELGDLGDILFIDRSFEEELKAVPRRLLVVDDKAEQKKNIERLKTILKQKRK